MMMIITMLLMIVVMIMMKYVGGLVGPWPVLREESSGDEELNAALIPPITFQDDDVRHDHDVDKPTCLRF